MLCLNNNNQKGRECLVVEGADLVWVVKEGLTEEVLFGLRHKSFTMQTRDRTLKTERTANTKSPRLKQTVHLEKQQDGD